MGLQDRQTGPFMIFSFRSLVPVQLQRKKIEKVFFFFSGVNSRKLSQFHYIQTVHLPLFARFLFRSQKRWRSI